MLLVSVSFHGPARLVRLAHAVSRIWLVARKFVRACEGLRSVWSRGELDPGRGLWRGRPRPGAGPPGFAPPRLYILVCLRNSQAMNSLFMRANDCDHLIRFAPPRPAPRSSAGAGGEPPPPTAPPPLPPLPPPSLSPPLPRPPRPPSALPSSLPAFVPAPSSLPSFNPSSPPSRSLPPNHPPTRRPTLQPTHPPFLTSSHPPILPSCLRSSHSSLSLCCLAP